MTIWEYEASRRWNGAWIGGTGPFACAVSYINKATSVTLFTKASEAAAHKHRLDSIQPEKKQWKSAEIINLKQPRAQRTNTTTGRR